jgi:citrate synthase
MTNTTIKSGLEGVVAAQTRLSEIDGQLGQLTIAGFPVDELAGRASFEEILHLLWHDSLPTMQELTTLQQNLIIHRSLPEATMNLLESAAAQKVSAMDALLMATSTLSLQKTNDTSADSVQGDAFTLVAAFPTIVAAYWRLLNGEEPIVPRPNLMHVANYLYMLSGEVPSSELVRGLETYLNTVVDHGLNASTFTARVIISTDSDMISAVVGALGALKGPRHGGAPGPALDTVFEIGEATKAEGHLRHKLEQGERLMGFGHRVYKVRDPRAEILSSAAERLYHSNGGMTLYQLARTVEKTAVDLLAEYKPGRNLQTNVEFYTALLLHGLGLPTDLFTPTFAMGRVAGWTAHCFEQQQEGRLIRPASVYSGAKNRHWIPVEQRQSDTAILSEP